MFSLPDRTSHPTVFADYLELSAICSESGFTAIKQVVSGFSFEDDTEIEDWADEDADREALVTAVQEVIEARIKIVGAAYPFRINDSGSRLTYGGVVDAQTSIYLFSLILSHSYDRTIVAECDAPALTNEVRNWFQALSTVAAGGFVEGVAISFGWPRPDRSAFATALKNTYQRFGEGMPLERARPAAPKRIKDGGIDIIAWKPSIDGLAGKLYLIGQVASGENWAGKSVKEDARLFHKFWFSQAPASQHLASMFMPFALKPEDPADPTVTYEELMDDHVQMLTDEFGYMFYRDRLSYYALHGVELVNAGNNEIEGFAQLASIPAWVEGSLLQLSGGQI